MMEIGHTMVSDSQHADLENHEDIHLKSAYSSRTPVSLSLFFHFLSPSCSLSLLLLLSSMICIFCLAPLASAPDVQVIRLARLNGTKSCYLGERTQIQVVGHTDQQVSSKS